MSAELPINQRLYDLIIWFINHLDNFPRSRRFTLGVRIENALYDMLERLIEARYESEKRIKLEKLRQANVILEKTRYFVRICFNQNLMSKKQYGFVSRQINDIGMPLGGWIKQIQRRS